MAELWKVLVTSDQGEEVSRLSKLYFIWNANLKIVDFEVREIVS